MSISTTFDRRLSSSPLTVCTAAWDSASAVSTPSRSLPWSHIRVERWVKPVTCQISASYTSGSWHRDKLITFTMWEYVAKRYFHTGSTVEMIMLLFASTRGQCYIIFHIVHKSFHCSIVFDFFLPLWIFLGFSCLICHSQNSIPLHTRSKCDQSFKLIHQNERRVIASDILLAFCKYFPVTRCCGSAHGARTRTMLSLGCSIYPDECHSVGVCAQWIGAKRRAYCMTQTAKCGIATEHHAFSLSHHVGGSTHVRLMSSNSTHPQQRASSFASGEPFIKIPLHAHCAP